MLKSKTIPVVDLTDDRDEAKYPAPAHDPAELECDEDLSDALTQPYQASDDEEDAKQAAPKKAKTNPRLGNSRHWLLTYPALTYEQANKHAVADNIDKHFSDQFSYCVISREKHEDGTPHIHVFITFRKLKQFRPRGILDKIIPGGKHGNYKACKYGTTNAMRNYVMKHKNYLENGIYISGDSDPYHQAINADSFKQANDILKEAKPRDFVVYHSQITQTLSTLHRPPPSAWVPPTNLSIWNVPDELSQWVDLELPKKDRARCLVLIGPSRTGKTTWARTLLQPHIYMRGEYNLKKLASTTDARLLIFDDCSALSKKSFQYRKQLLTQMGECSLTDKYKGKLDVNITCPAIVLCNTRAEVPWCTDPNFSCVFDDYAYWQLNAYVVEIENKLY